MIEIYGPINALVKSAEGCVFLITEHFIIHYEFAGPGWDG